MASDKLSRDPGHTGDEPSEGVRIIAADELEEATDRAEVAHRRPKDEPRYGDRPSSPTPDVEPTIRFPLPDSADLSAIARPRPAPVDPPRAEGSVDRAPTRPMPGPPDVEVTPVSLGADSTEVIDLSDEASGPQPEIDPITDATGQPDVVASDVVASEADEPPTHVSEVSESDQPETSGSEGDQAEDPEGLTLEPLTLEEVGFDDRPPPPASAPPASPAGSETDDQPVLDLGPSTGENALPHWTEPPTGEVPKVVIGDGDEDEEERWASFTQNATRWRDEHDVSDHGDLMADLAAAGDDEPVSERLGALDTSERIEDDAFLNFDDVELDPRKPARGPSRWSRGRGSRSATPEGTRPDAPDLPRAFPSSSVRPIPGPPTSAGATPGPDVREPAATLADDAATGAAAGAAPAAATPDGPTARPARRPRVQLQGEAPPDDDPAAPTARRRRTAPEPSGSAKAGSGGRDLPQAIAVGAALALVALLAFVAGPAPTMVLVAVVIAVAGVEYFGAVYRGGFRPATLLGLVAVAALPVATYWKGEAAFPVILALTFVVGVLWYILGVSGKGVRPTANLGVTLLGVVWVGVLGAFAALILKIPGQGVSILLVAVVAAVAYDTGGFFIGRAMGRTPLTTVSPNKTVEGLVGGMVSAVAGVLVVVLLGFSPFSNGQAIVVGLVLALAAPLGDLAESLFKRDLGLKDMGSLLPEHGGVLDRFDGMLFVLPAAYYVARVFNLAA